MSLRITDLEGSWEIDVPVRQAIMEALRLQIMRLQQKEVFLGPVCEKIGQRIAETVLDILDPDLRPPTEAQIRFALDIARELSVNLPGEALQYRGAMGEFIERFQALFYSRRNRKLL